MKNKILHNQKGLSLLEIVVSMFVIMLLVLGIYGLIIFSLNITSDNKMYVNALRIANQKMEQVFNLPYDEVGISGGNPEGVLISDESIERRGLYAIHTDVSYYDDDYDGLDGLGDDDGDDYKVVTITVGFEGKAGSREVILFSKMVPNSL